MPHFNVSKVLKNPKFLDSIIIHRNSGDWSGGRFIQSSSQINAKAVVVATATKDIIPVPEGDRASEQKTFYCLIPLFVTNSSGTSDEIEWHNTKYKLISVNNWESYGFYKAIGIGA